MRLAWAIVCIAGAIGASACGGAEPAAASEHVPANPTFAADIRPILERSCAACHTPGQAAPFPLLTYADAQERATRIADAVAARRMPPWLPDGPAHEFTGDRRLTDRDIETIRRWAANGAPEGAPTSPIASSASHQWTLGTPDLVVTMPEAYRLRPQHGDEFRNFVFPVDGFDGAYVRAMEFLPGATRAIHHAVISVDNTRASRRKDGADGAPGYAGMFAQGTQSPDGHFLGWTPGRGPVESPSDLPWRLERGSDLVVQLHMLPGTEVQTIAPSIGLYFTRTPPSRTPVMLRLGSKAIDIPPGATDYATEDSYTLPVDVDLLSVYPHAHYLGREMTAEARLPDGRRMTLLHIPRWDFHWQQDYRFVTPRVLPRGTVIHTRFTWDNSPRGGPHAAHGGAPAGGHGAGRGASARVLYGQRSTDEMGDLWLQVVPRQGGDVVVLRRDMAQRETTADIAGGEMLVRRAPGVAANFVFLGNAYVDAGRADEAAAALREAVRLDNSSADAHNGLGRALFILGQVPEAIEHFQRASMLDAQDERAYFNLAGALLADDRSLAAAAALRRAVSLNPDFAEAHNNLGVVRHLAGHLDEAVACFTQAVRANPTYADAHSNLGAALASAGRLAEAAPHLQRAVELNPGHLQAQANLRAVLDTLGERD